MDNDNTVSLEGRRLQIPADEYRYHYVRTNVRVHRYVDGTLAVFHGPRRLASYDAQGKPWIAAWQQEREGKRAV